LALTVKEMETLCVFHAGSLAATVNALQSAADSGKSEARMADIKSLLDKLSRMADGDVVSLAFEAEK